MGSLAERLEHLELMGESFGKVISARIDRIIQEARYLAQVIRLCPHCGVQMVRDGTMYTCPTCGLCRDDSDEPTAEFAPATTAAQDGDQ